MTSRGLQKTKRLEPYREFINDPLFKYTEQSVVYYLAEPILHARQIIPTSYREKYTLFQNSQLVGRTLAREVDLFFELNQEYISPTLKERAIKEYQPIFSPFFQQDSQKNNTDHPSPDQASHTQFAAQDPDMHFLTIGMIREVLDIHTTVLNELEQQSRRKTCCIISRALKRI